MNQLLTLLSLLSITLLICSCSQDQESNQQSPSAESWIIERSHYDSLTYNPKLLSGGASSVEGLIREVLDALQREDTLHLQSLAISPEEYSSIIYPELGKYWGGARDRRPVVRAWMGENHFGSSEKGLLRGLRDFGGRRLRLDSIDFGDRAQRYPSYTLYQGTTVTLLDEESQPFNPGIFGSIVSKDGKYKLLSYRDER